jgi:hypothetical protein
MPRLSEVVADRFPPATPSPAAGGIDGRVKRKFPKLSRKKIILFSSILVGVTAISIGIYALLDNRPTYRYSSYSSTPSSRPVTPAIPQPATPSFPQPAASNSAVFRIWSQLTAGQTREVVTISSGGNRLGTIVLNSAKTIDQLTLEFTPPAQFDLEVKVYTNMANGSAVFGTSNAHVNLKGGEEFWVVDLGPAGDGISNVYGLQKAK